MVQITAVTSAIHIDVWNAAQHRSLPSSLSYQCRLKPVIGKPPNIEALKDSTTVTMMGANMKM